MMVDLQSFRAELELAHQNILSLESQIKSKKHSIHQLRWERDGCIDELEAECGKHQTTLERLALADAESASARAEVESAREAMSLAVKNLKNFEEFEEEILEGGYASYCIGYEDGQDAVEKLYPDLDLSRIILSCSGDEAAKKGAALAEDDAPTVPKAVSVIDAVSEHGDEDND